MTPYQSLLFVPGNRPDRFTGALASGADLVTIDLEDAVGSADKTTALDAALRTIDSQNLGVRINGLRTRQGLADLIALAGAAIPPPFVMVPMVEAPAEIEIVRAALPGVAVLPLIETIRGLRAADAIAAAPAIGGVMLGGADLAAELGVAPSVGRAVDSTRADRFSLCRRARAVDRRAVVRARRS